MSLNVSPELTRQATEGSVSPQAFIQCIQESLPHAWAIFAHLDEELHHRSAGHAIHAPRSMPEEERSQLLRALASNAIREAVERHFGYILAFRNCHMTAAFRPSEVNSPAYREFTSVESQILNQSPELRDC